MSNPHVSGIPTAPPRPRPKCVYPGCDRTLIRAAEWRRLSDERKAELKAQGAAKRTGRGLCARDYKRARVAGELIDYERGGLAHTVVLEEWQVLREDGHTKRQAAERLGMSYKAFEKALERAS